MSAAWNRCRVKPGRYITKRSIISRSTHPKRNTFDRWTIFLCGCGCSLRRRERFRPKRIGKAVFSSMRGTFLWTEILSKARVRQNAVELVGPTETFLPKKKSSGSWCGVLQKAPKSRHLLRSAGEHVLAQRQGRSTGEAFRLIAAFTRGTKKLWQLY